jgi:hypothetical protein
LGVNDEAVLHDGLGILLVFGQRSFLTLVLPACRTPPHEPDAMVREEVEGDTGVIVAVDPRQDLPVAYYHVIIYSFQQAAMPI